MELTPSLKDHVTEKMGRLEKYTDHNMSVEVFLGVEKFRNKIHASVRGKGFQIDSEAEEVDSMYKAIDQCVDRLETQLRRGKHNRYQTKSDKRTIRLKTPKSEMFDGSENGSE